MTRPPADARCGLYRHGDRVSERAALELLSSPGFVAHWVICPDASGDTLSLRWRAACTLAELHRASQWNALQLARLQADGLPSGKA